ncbi:MAG TPA: carboxypeptidase regulatory-like domain-containing protein, partial [Thermoplasmata archaeon]|nr:carboxypeptidase regulatory-like domain-containing protein [Thermoplasmata archaeon]
GIQGASEDWEHGAPTKTGGASPQAHSAPNSWVTRLALDYAGDTGAVGSYGLLTPNVDLSNALNAQLRFWQWFSFELSGGVPCDGGLVEVSTNGGTSWTSITPVGGYTGTMGDGGTNCGITDIEGAQAFTGISGGWQQKTFDLTPYIGTNTVKVRWHFAWDNFVSDAGWYVDDVAITFTPKNVDIRLVANPLKIGETGTSRLTITAKVAGAAHSGATVQATSSLGGSFNPPAPTTDPAGRATMDYTAPSVTVDSTAWIRVWVNKTGYNSGMGNTNITVYNVGSPVLYTWLNLTKNEEYATIPLPFTVEVTDGASRVPTTAISMGDTQGGTFTPASGNTDAQGRFTGNYSAKNSVNDYWVTLFANSTKATYSDGQGSAILYVTSFAVPTITAPAPNTSLNPTTTVAVTWTGVGGVLPVTANIHYSNNSTIPVWKQIAITQPQSGSYNWVIPVDPSNFSLLRVQLRDKNAVGGEHIIPIKLLTYPVPTVTVTAPNGGESWAAGTAQSITWTGGGGIGTKLYNISWSSTGPNGTYNTVANDQAGPSYSWNVANTPGPDNYVKIEVRDQNNIKATDISNANFTILPMPLSVHISVPNGAELWAAQSVKSIFWKALGGTGVLMANLSYSTNGSAGPWKSVANNVPAGQGVYNWTVPLEPSTNCLIRILVWDTAGKTITDDSNATFTIVPPPITVTLTAPNGGEQWMAQSTQSITWTASGGFGTLTVALDYSTSSQSGPWKQILPAGSPNTGSHSWTVPADPSNTAYVRVVVRDQANQQVEDPSDGAFSITVPVPTMKVNAPNGGETWTIGSTEKITWTASGGTGSLTVDLSYATQGCGAAFTPIAQGIGNSGSHDWPIPAAPSQAACVKAVVKDQNNQQATDTSDLTFAIRFPVMTVTVDDPKAGDEWKTGEDRTINWTVGGGVPPTTNTKVEWKKGASWEIIQDGVSGTTVTWKVPTMASTTSQIRVTVTDSGPQTVSGVSGTFTIKNPGDTTGSVRGLVKNNKGKTVQDAKVEVLEMANIPGFETNSTMTDEFGDYIFGKVPVGVWTVRASKAGVGTDEYSVEVFKSQATTQDFELKPPPAPPPDPNAVSGIVIGGIVAAIIAVVVILLLVLLMMKSKKAKQDQQMQRAMQCPNCGRPKPPQAPLCQQCA